MVKWRIALACLLKDSLFLVQKQAGGSYLKEITRSFVLESHQVVTFCFKLENKFHSLLYDWGYNAIRRQNLGVEGDENPRQKQGC